MTEGEVGEASGPDGASADVGVARVGLMDSARRWGALAWSESRLSEVLAAAAAAGPDGDGGSAAPATVVELATAARRHAVRSGVVRDRLPELRELPVEVVLRPGTAAWAAELDALPATDLPALLAVYTGRVLPALAGAYRASSAAASGVAEPTARRVLAALAEEADADRRSWADRGVTAADGPVAGPLEVLGEPAGA